MMNRIKLVVIVMLLLVCVSLDTWAYIISH